MGATVELKEVKVVWDNRENKMNFEHHKPHFVVVFKDDTDEAQDRLKINCTGDDKGRMEQYGLWLRANGKSKTFLFVVETGTMEKDGKSINWKAIREVKNTTGLDILDGQPPILESKPVAAPPQSTPPPAKVEKPKSTAPVTPPPAAKGVKQTWIERMMVNQSEEFCAERRMADELGFTREAAFKAAVDVFGSTLVRYSEKGEVEIQIEAMTGLDELEGIFAAHLRGARSKDRVIHFMSLLDRCNKSKPDIIRVMTKAGAELSPEEYKAVKVEADKIYKAPVEPVAEPEGEDYR